MLLSALGVVMSLLGLLAKLMSCLVPEQGPLFVYSELFWVAMNPLLYAQSLTFFAGSTRVKLSEPPGRPSDVLRHRFVRSEGYLTIPSFLLLYVSPSHS